MEIIPFSDKVGYGSMNKFVGHLFLLGYLKADKRHYISELLLKLYLVNEYECKYTKQRVNSVQ